MFHNVAMTRYLQLLQVCEKVDGNITPSEWSVVTGVPLTGSSLHLWGHPDSPVTQKLDQGHLGISPQI